MLLAWTPDRAHTGAGKGMGWSHSALSLDSVSRECLPVTFSEEPEPGTGEVAQELRALSSP